MTGVEECTSVPPPFPPPRAELTQESPSNGSGGQGQGLSSDESSSPPSAVPQALTFSPEKVDFPPSQAASTGAAQGEAEPGEEPEQSLHRRAQGEDMHPGEVHGES